MYGCVSVYGCLAVHWFVTVYGCVAMIAYRDPTMYAQPPRLGVGVLVRWGSLYAK